MSTFDLEGVRSRHLDPAQLAGETLQEGHVLFDLYAAYKEIKRLQAQIVKTERLGASSAREIQRLQAQIVKTERLGASSAQEIQHLKTKLLQSEHFGASATRENFRLEDKVERLQADNHALSSQLTPEKTHAGIVLWMQRIEAQRIETERLGASADREMQRLEAQLLQTERLGASADQEMQRLKAQLLQTERLGASAAREIARLKDEVELLRAENRALGEQTTSEETRADIVRWMRRTADHYAEQSELVGHGLANVWRIIATLIAEERDLPSMVGAWRPARTESTQSAP